VRNVFSTLINGASVYLVGTSHRLYYLYNGSLVNITPLKTTSTAIPNSLATHYLTLATNPITVQNGSNLVTVAYTHRVIYAGDTVTISGATSTQTSVTGGLHSGGTGGSSTYGAGSSAGGDFSKPATPSAIGAAGGAGASGGATPSIIGPSTLPANVTNPGTFSEGFYKGIADNAKPAAVGALGIGALSAMNADKNKFGVPEEETYTGPLSKFKYDPSTFNPTYPTPPNPAYEAQYAEGGIASINQDYAKGGIAGLLKGRGDGMSDSIQATIADKQPARLADGEFVVPADVVSHLGNGSTDAGAKHLYGMMDKVRKARTGTKKQGKQIAAGGYLPA